MGKKTKEELEQEELEELEQEELEELERLEAEEKAKAKADKEPTVKSAEEKASKAKTKVEIEKLILQEAMHITDAKTNSVQQLMAYCRQLKKHKK